MAVPQRVLGLAARLVAGRLPDHPEREPGWHFDFAARHPRPMTSLRRVVWECYRDRGTSRALPIAWYENLKFRLLLGNDLSLCLYVGGSFEPNEFAYLEETLKPGMVFIDCGANEGLYTLYAARRIGPAGRVLAIEPSTREVQRLRANIALNQLNNITIEQVALGNQSKRALLTVAGPGHEALNTMSSIEEPLRQEEVQVETLDALVDRHQLERVDLIKLDIEGSEVQALLGSGETIERFSPILLIEAEETRLASMTNGLDDLLAILDEHQYAVQIFDEQTGRLRPANRPREPATTHQGNIAAAPKHPPKAASSRTYRRHESSDLKDGANP
jgi:FkbM family methyltransferase